MSVKPKSSPGRDQPPSFDAMAFINTLPNRPGVYRMLDSSGVVIYVGKARQLRKRISSYFSRQSSSTKTQVMVSKIKGIEITITRNDTEALILENNQIKSLKPRYNILLRDDKSYPYIFLSATQEFPRISLYRGPQRESGRYFGPYPSATAARESLYLIQKVFPIRQCEDSFFRNRSRPCLQYQIKRCAAPCVGYVDQASYGEDVKHAVMFLEGRSNQVIDELVAQMDRASAALEFEDAASLRDQITSLRRTQEKQYITSDGGDLDVIACAVKDGVACVQVFYIRGGRNLGNKAYFPRHAGQSDVGGVLDAFLPQYYLAAVRNTSQGHEVPALILVNEPVSERHLMEKVLINQAGHRVAISCPARGDRARWMALAVSNATQGLNLQLAARENVLRRFEALQDALGLDHIPQRIECFDISHTMGEATVASCVVFDTNGAVKADYRRFNIEGIKAGDDYRAMNQVLKRRYTRIIRTEAKLPDILLVDGGKGQVTEAVRVLQELQVSGVTIIGVAKGSAKGSAKGPHGKAGTETLYLAGYSRGINLPADSPALHLIQQVRDEAHRFAITGHRQRRAKSRSRSVLEGVKGLGVKRRRQLLKQFGGLQEVLRAGVEDLARVHGISKLLAQRIYDELH